MDYQSQAPQQNGILVQPKRDYGIDMEMVMQEYGVAKTHTDRYTTDFPTLDTIADGIPVTHEDGSPYVGDTTLAGLVRLIPRACLEQLPVFAAIRNGSKNSINALLDSFILRHCVFNEDTFGKGLLSTMQVGGEEALKHGYALFMTATGSMVDEFGTHMKLLHYADVAPEPGIQDFNEASYFYVKANLTKSRVKRILKAALANPNTTWNIPALQELLEMSPTTQNYSIYQSWARQNNVADSAPTYEFITRYDVGKEGQFPTFCPQIPDEPLRVIDNKSKFGYPRIQGMVIDPAPLTPFGISRVRLASPNQNLMNAYMQNVARMFIINSDPPLLKRGRFTKPVQLKRRAVWETLDQNATVELKEMSNSSLQQFVPIAQQMSAQIQNIMGMPQGNTSGNNSTMGFSKTAPGVKQQEKFTDTATNQITNIMENFLRQYGLVALDTYIAEQISDDDDDPNVDVLIVDDECKNAVNRVHQDSYLEQGGDPETYVPYIGDDNTVEMNWNEYYDDVKTWRIEVEISIAKDELEAKKRADLQDTLTVMTQNDKGDNPAKTQKIDELEDRLLEDAVPESSRLSTLPKPVAPVAPVAQTATGDQTTMNQ